MQRHAMQCNTMYGKKIIQSSGHNSYRFQGCSDGDGALERLPFVVWAEEPVALVPLIATARTLLIISGKQMARKVDPEDLYHKHPKTSKNLNKSYQTFTTTVQHGRSLAAS